MAWSLGLFLWAVSQPSLECVTEVSGGAVELAAPPKVICTVGAVGLSLLFSSLAVGWSFTGLKAGEVDLGY